MAEAHYIDSPAALAGILPRLRAASSIAVDTESDSMHAYQEKVCFLQLAAGGEIFLVDTLAVRDLSELRPVFASPDLPKILHGADYDVVCLKRDFDLRIDGLFDTMIAAQFLGKERIGLADLVAAYFDVRLDKSLTRHDWARRPLERRHLAYLEEDVRHLAALRDRIAEEIARADIVEEVSLEFQRVTTLEWRGGRFDPEGYVRIRGAHRLDRVGRTVLRELHLLRDGIARRLDQPPFRVFNNEFLIAVASNRPRNLDDLARIPGASDYLLRHRGEAILGAVASGLAVVRDPAPSSGGARPPHDPVRFRADRALRSWRRDTAARRGVTTGVVLPSHVLDRIVEAMPAGREALAQIAFLGARRLARDGEAILRCLAEARDGGSGGAPDRDPVTSS